MQFSVGDLITLKGLENHLVGVVTNMEWNDTEGDWRMLCQWTDGTKEWLWVSSYNFVKNSDVFS